MNPNASVGSVTGSTPLCIGVSTTYTANTVVLGGGTGTWSSSDATIASVDPSTGSVLALKAGSTTISYTVTGGCGGTATASLV